MIQNHIPRYLLQRNENLCSHKNLYINVYSSFTYYRQKSETTQCPSIGKGIKRSTFIQRILLTNTKEQSSNIQNDMDESQKHAERKKMQKG